MNVYLQAQNRTNEAILSAQFTPDELQRFSKSDIRWVDGRRKNFTQKGVKKGEVYQFEFGKNYIPEMSYEHRGLVLGVKQRLLYVLPIFTYDSGKHKEVYHPVDFPSSRSDLFLLKSSEYAFITHDSVLKLNDLRTVSINRILYQQNGRIAPNSDTFRIIETLVLKKYFPSFLYDNEKCTMQRDELSEELAEYQSKLKCLESENQQLQDQILSLESHIST